MKAKGVKKIFWLLKSHIDQGIFHASVGTPASRLFWGIMEAVLVTIGIYMETTYMLDGLISISNNTLKKSFCYFVQD